MLNPMGRYFYGKEDITLFLSILYFGMLAPGLIFSINLLLLFLAGLDLRCCAWAFSSCSEQGLLSSCGARASHCGGFSCCGA